MIELNKNIWDFIGTVNVICIPTNGYINSNGKAVMNNKTALQALKLFPNLDLILGNKLSHDGNHVHYLTTRDYTKILSFPVKPDYVICNCNNILSNLQNKFTSGQRIPGYNAKPDTKIIKKSLLQLYKLAQFSQWESICLPKIGCDPGELDWESEVKPLVSQILDNDHFFIVDNF